MPTIRLDIPDTPPQPAPLGLLVPIPPDTAHQRIESARYPDVASLKRCRALNGDQAAVFLPGLAGAGTRFEFGIRAGTGASPRTHFTPIDSRYSRPSAELKAAIEELTKSAANQQAALESIVGFTASLFDYDHPQARFCDGKDEVPLLLQLTKGSCTDINTFLLSSLYAAGIPATYYAGFFFENGKPRSTTGFHCWISSLARGEHQDWDIAHHLKKGMRDVLPGLNPTPGERVAMSYARGLRFEVADCEAEFTHFAYPMWIYPGGRYEPAQAVATLL
jgi:hypothetical protein